MTHQEKNEPDIIFHEAQFVLFPRRGQSNIYGLLSLDVDGGKKLVVATLRGEIYCLEFHKAQVRPPSFNPICFTYIPADAEVISIDAIVKEPNGVIIGVTLIKRDSDPKEVYFNLYGIHCDPSATFNWEKVAEDWQPISLKFVPFQLTHTEILSGDKWESVFLLPGDDLKIHLYRETFLSELCFQEESSDMLFPELQDLPSSVTYMDMKLVGLQRVTVLGCQNGYLQCSIVNLTTSSVVKSWNTKMIDGPITSVKLFTIASTGVPDSLKDYHLLVASAVELGAVFFNVAEGGLTKPVVLPSSQLHDSVLCATVADVNWDGRNELIIGTYGKEVMIYQFQITKKDSPSKYHSPPATVPGVKMIWQRSFSHPLHSVWYGDLTHDGMCELAVVSMGGVHVLQHDLQQASEVCLRRLAELKIDENKLTKTQETEDVRTDV